MCVYHYLYPWYMYGVGLTMKKNWSLGLLQSAEHRYTVCQGINGKCLASRRGVKNCAAEHLLTGSAAM